MKMPWILDFIMPKILIISSHNQQARKFKWQSKDLETKILKFKQEWMLFLHEQKF